MNYYEIFKEINNIPRPSHHEEKIADYLCQFAEKHGLRYKRDEHNCIVIEKPASPGYEDHEPVVILNHMDMVCVAKPEKKFNPLTDGIEQIVEEKYMHANGTSLGADNGIGLSMALAILADDTLQHPALEVLTTTNEEDGMSGASNLASDFIKGRKVLNLDSEAYDEITVGAAGALIQTSYLPFHRIQMPKGYLAYTVEVSGGQGGHSGVDITKGRANAIKILANLLLVAIRQCDIKLYLVNFEGGNAAASIPSSAKSKVIIPIEKMDDFETLVNQCDEALQAEFSETDPDVEVTATPSVWRSSVVSEEGTHLLLAALNGIPVGPMEMLDETTPMTSNNIGVVKTHNAKTNADPNLNANVNCFEVSTHTRSFSNERMENVARQIKEIFIVSGADVEEVMNAPAWKEDENNELVTLACRTFNEVLGFEPKKVSMHFVLEAGYFVQKFPGIHIASIGPRILEPHSVNERVELSTIDNIWKVAVAILRKL